MRIFLDCQTISSAVVRVLQGRECLRLRFQRPCFEADKMATALPQQRQNTKSPGFDPHEPEHSLPMPLDGPNSTRDTLSHTTYFNQMFNFSSSAPCQCSQDVARDKMSFESFCNSPLVICDLFVVDDRLLWVPIVRRLFYHAGSWGAVFSETSLDGLCRFAHAG